MKTFLQTTCLILYLALSNFVYPISLNKNLLRLFKLNTKLDQKKNPMNTYIRVEPKFILKTDPDKKLRIQEYLYPDVSSKLTNQSIEDETIGRAPQNRFDKKISSKRKKKVSNFHRDLKNFRRDFATSSSREAQDFKSEFEDMWTQKKYEAINMPDIYKGADRINMAAARPWGVPCGDTSQHDIPWGSCMMPQECDAEFRIYRGDNFCGRSNFICCSIMLTNYDMYEGIDVSWDPSSFSTDTEEKKARQKSSKEIRKKKKDRQKRKREKIKKTRKIKMQKTIKKIEKEMKILLQKQLRNGTKEREKRTRFFKGFITTLKEKYRKDRQAVYKHHDRDMLAIDKSMNAQLQELLAMNNRFIGNDTFRQIVLNGTYTPQAARMLWNAFKQQQAIMKLKTRRGLQLQQQRPRYFEYDIEYGYLYS